MNNQPMHDDDFLSQFRKTPRPEFTRNLYAKITQEDDNPMQSISTVSTTLSYNGTHAHPGTRRSAWDQRAALVAALIALALLSTLILWFNRPAPEPIPAVGGDPISPENAAQIAKLATLGQGTVTSVAWSPDGQYLALPGTVGVWLYKADDLSKPFTLIPNDVGYSLTARFTDDSQHLIINDYTGVQVWDIATQKSTPLPGTLGEYIGFDISPDGKLAAMGDFKGNLTVVDLQTNEVKTHFSLQYSSNPIMEVSFSPDGKRIAFTGNNLPVLALQDPTGTWDNVETDPVVYQPETQDEGGTWSLHFNETGSLLTARVGTDIYLWDTATAAIQTVLHTVPPVEEQPTTEPLPPGSNTYGGMGGGGGGGGGGKGGGGDLTFSPDGTQFVTIDQAVRLWNVATGESRELIPADPNNYPASVAFNADWTQMAQLNTFGLLRILDVATGDEIARIDQYDVRGVIDVDFNADDTRLAAFSDDNMIHVWDVSDLDNVPPPLVLRDISPNAIYGFQHLSFVPDQPALLAALTGNGVGFWDVETGRAGSMWQNLPNTQQNFVYNSFLTYSPDGTRAVSGSADGMSAYIWDTAAQQVMVSYSIETGLTFVTAAFSPDGKRVAFSVATNMNSFPQPENQAQTYRVDVWDIDTNAVTFTIPDQTATVVSIAYSPNGKFIATAGGDNTVQLWDAETGKPTRMVENGNPVGTLAFSPDGKLLATAEFDQATQVNILRVWDMSGTNDQPLVTVNDPLGSSDLAFSHNGMLLAASSSNGTIDVWGVP